MLLLSASQKQQRPTFWSVVFLIFVPLAWSSTTAKTRGHTSAGSSSRHHDISSITRVQTPRRGDVCSSFPPPPPFPHYNSRLLAFAASSTSSRGGGNKKKKRRGTTGGGFGSSSGSSSSSSTNKKKRKKKNKTLISQDDLFVQQKQDDDDVVVVLDKWGLPPPTEADIFPPMPPGTELIAARAATSSDDGSTSAYTLDEIQNAICNCLPLPGLTRFFDPDSCEQKKSSTYLAQQQEEEQTTNRCRKQPMMKLRLVHESPAVLVIDNFLTPQECLEIEQVAMPGGDSSSSSSSSKQVVEVGSATFSEDSASSSSSSAITQFSKRTSTSWFCEYKAVPQLLAAAQHVLGLKLQCMEEPQIVRYQTGQEFSWHYDQVPPPQLQNGGQRMATLLVYLNTVQNGGGTVFRDLRPPGGSSSGDDDDSNENNMLTVQPVQGRACLFFPATFPDNTQNTATAARPDDRTLHKGQVAMDEKRIVQIWIHQDDYQATLPSPLNRQEDAIPAVHDLARQRQWNGDDDNDESTNV